VAKKGLLLGGGLAQLGPQLMGVGVVAVAVFALSLAFWLVTKILSNGLRVSQEEEMEGLDLHEHGNSAYPDFSVRAFPIGTTTLAPTPPIIAPAGIRSTEVSFEKN
jgi:Amt family ammonium transporter